MWRFNHLVLLIPLVSGCAQTLTGPTAAVWPAAGKPLEVFSADDTVCRQFAERQTGSNPQQAATERTASGAVVGTAVGAAAGAALGAAAGGPARGAAAGAGLGLLTGVAGGAASGNRAEYTLQQRYNIAYQQCMYTKGNQIPGSTGVAAGPPPPPSMASPSPTPSQAQAWYYHCKKPMGYYPYVQDCPGGWQPMPATPQG